MTARYEVIFDNGLGPNRRACSTEIDAVAHADYLVRTFKGVESAEAWVHDDEGSRLLVRYQQWQE